MSVSKGYRKISFEFFIRVIALWIAFYSFWLISAIGVKKSVRGTSCRRSIGIRLLLVVIAFVRLFRIQEIWVLTRSASIGIAGVVVCVAGLGSAVWARRHLGRNWGTPMSLPLGKAVPGPIYRLASQGLDDRDIAARLNISEKMVRGCIAWLWHFLRYQSRADLLNASVDQTGRWKLNAA